MGIFYFERKRFGLMLLFFFAGVALSTAQCPSVTNPNQSFCDLQSPTVSSLAAVNNGGGVVWYATATSTTPLSPSAGLVNGEDYFADSTAGSCGVRPSVVVTIYTAPTGQNFQGVCVSFANEATIADLIANGNNIQWYSTPSGGTPLSSSTILTDNTIYYASQTNPQTGCETSRLSVFVNVGLVPVPTGASQQEFCNPAGGPAPTVANLVASGANNWYLTATSAVPLSNSTPLINGQSYYATTVDPPCESTSRLEVTVTLVQPYNSGTNGSISICQNQVASTGSINLFSLLGGSPQNTGMWTGPVATTNGFQGTLNVSGLTAVASPYVFTYSISGVCTTSSSTVTVNILPTPVASISQNATICSGSSVPIMFTGTPNSTVTYTVNGGSNQSVVIGASGSTTINQTLTANTVYSLVSVSSATTPSCTQAVSGSVTITVLPLPTASIASNVTVCSGGAATITFTGTPSSTVTYNINGGPNQTIALNASGSATITGNFTSTTSYNLVSVASAGTPSCVRTLSGSAVVTVVQPPVVTISGSASVCPNTSATITFSGTPNAIVTYTVNGGVAQTIQLNSSGSATITGTYSTTTVYQVTGVTTGGTPSCPAPASGTATITVVPLPTATIASNQTICAGNSATVTFSGTPNATVTYTVNGGSNQTIGLGSSGAASITNTFAATTVYTLVSVTSAGSPSCSQPLAGSATITVIPLPTATISANTSICAGQPATVTFTGTPNTTVAYTVNGVNQTILLNSAGSATVTNTYAATTTFNLVSISTGGMPSCSRPLSGSVVITVTPLPTATISGNSTICQGGSAVFTISGTPNATVTYVVGIGPNQTVVLNGSGTATISGTYTATTIVSLVSVTASGSPACTQTLSGSITITVVPLPTAAISSNSTICAGQSATVTFTGTPGATVTYNVNGGASQTIILNNSGTAAITQTYNGTTVYNLVSASTSGTPACTQNLTGSVTITVIPPPTATVSASPTAVCQGSTSTITISGTPNATVVYNINGGANQTVVLNASGTATLTQTITTQTVVNLVSATTSGTPNCTQPLTSSVTISNVALPVVTISGSAQVCPNATATVTVTGTPNAVVTYSINGGAAQTITLNASGTAAITQTYSATTTYTLISATTSGTPACSQPANGSAVITVQPLPTVTISSNSTICAGQSATVTFTGTPNAVVQYNINGGPAQTITLNASGVATITNPFSTTTTFNLNSVATAGAPGCSQPVSGSVTITVIPLPTVTISAEPATVCSGSNATVSFTGTPNAVVTYTLNGGNNQTITLNSAGIASISLTPTQTSTFTLVSITLAGTPSCSQPVSGSAVITVTQPPVVTIASGATVCSGGQATVTFTGTPNAIVTYTINGGGNQQITLNSSGSAAISSAFTSTTTYSLVSASTAGSPACSQPQTGSVTITVLQLPTATISGNATICSGNSADVTFTGTPNAVVSYTINGGATQNITLNASGSAVLPGTYTQTTTIALISATSAGTPQCVQQLNDSVTITVVALPVVTISGNASICPNSQATVSFSGTPGAVVNYTSNGVAQTITLNASGNATLTATFTEDTTFVLTGVISAGSPACAGQAIGTVTISIVPPPTVSIASDQTICSGGTATITFTGTPNSVVTYNLGGGAVFSINIGPSGTATITQTYTFTTSYYLESVTSQGSPGCTQPATGSATITVLPLPTASIPSSLSVCSGENATITFTGTPGGVVTFAVNGGASQTITIGASGTANYETTFTSSATITLISITSGGAVPCSQPLSGSTTVTVIALPTASVSVASTPICQGSAATLSFNGTPNATVTYTVNGGGIQTIVLDASGTATLNSTFTQTSTIQLVGVVTSGTPSCSQSLSGSATVVVTAAPNAGTDVGNFPICANAQPLDLFALLGSDAQAGGSWIPALSGGGGIFNPAIDAGGTYTYTVAGLTPCPADTSTVNVTVVAPPNAGNDAAINICSNANPVNLFTLLGTSAQTGGTWTPSLAGGTGIFNPAVDVAGSYTYTVSGTLPCGNASATIAVTVTPGPDAGQDGTLTLCSNSTPQDLFNFLNGTPQPGGVWSPALSGGNGIFNPATDAPGVYTYTFFGNQPCDNDTATVTVTVNPVPDAGTDGTAFFCTNYAPADLFGSLGGSPQTGGTWSPALASGTGVFNPLVDAPGVYTYTVGGNLCSTSTATVTVSVVQSPNAGGNGATLLITTCLTTTSVDLFTALNGSQGVGTWNDDDATGALTGNIFNPSTIGPGTYHFTYTVGGGVSPCLFDTATVTVVVQPLPVAGTFTGVQIICTSVGTFDLATLLTGAQPGGVWTDPNGQTVQEVLNVSTFAAGTYSFTYTVTTACGTDTETVQLTVLPIPVLTIPNLTVATPICVGQNASFSLSGMADGIYNITYSLTGANNEVNQTVNAIVTAGAGSFIIPSQTLSNLGTTTVTFTSIANTVTGCSSALSNVLVNIVVLPATNLEDSNISIADACLGTSITVSIANAAGLPDGNYQFNYTVPTAVPPTASTGIVSVVNGAGQFTVPGSIFQAAGNYALSLNQIVSLSSGCSNLSENATATFVIFPAPDASGAVLSASEACVNFSNVVTISGAVNLPDGNYLLGYQLSGASTAVGSIPVTISGGSGNFTIPALELQTAGNVTVSITQLILGSIPCGANVLNFTPVTFAVAGLGTPQILPQGNEFCAAQNPTIANLSANIQGQQPVVWFDAPAGGNQLQPSTPLQPGATYYGAFVAASGCESSIRLEVTVDLSVCPLDILIPDGFSPNGDGINDTFEIVNINQTYPNFRLEIYNRYGNILYKGNRNTPNWDGTTSEGGIKTGNGVVPTGVYFYVLEFNDGSRKPQQGRLYLSR